MSSEDDTTFLTGLKRPLTVIYELQCHLMFTVVPILIAVDFIFSKITLSVCVNRCAHHQQLHQKIATLL